MPNYRYQPEDRLRSSVDYERVLKRQCKVRGPNLLIFGCMNNIGRPRLGRIVSKRWGNAVVRNRYRRWIREAFRKVKGKISSIDIVVMPARALASFSDVSEEFLPSILKLEIMVSDGRHEHE